MIEQAQVNLDRMVDTPVPMNYVIHVNQMIFLYLLTLPFCLISLV
jgi:predicted membrane chloride channel (bestrophin family)